MSEFSFGKNTKVQLESVHPLLQLLAHKAIELTTQDFGVPVGGGYRTAEQQKVSFDQGYSNCDGTIKKSYHQSGLACDFVPWINGKYDWSVKQAFLDVHKAIHAAWDTMDHKGHELVWGGDWKNSWDKPHYELRKLNEI
jgi:peptidoglycan L-alanyl-D-glutamate endopeptidase CwlK